MTRSRGAHEPPDLTLTDDQVRTLLETVGGHLNAFRDRLAKGELPASYVHDSLDADAYADGSAAALELAEAEPPESGTDVEDLLKQLFGTAMTNGTLHPHPGFMAHVPSGGMIEGAIGEFIARAVNRFAGVWLAAPGYQQIEKNVIRWFCSMLGYGEQAFGYLTTGGSLANFMATRCALTAAGAPHADGTFYTSDQSHFSVVRAAVLAGLPAERVRCVPTVDCRMDLVALTAAIAADRAAGLHPVCVVGTAGTTNTGAVDDLTAIGNLCHAQQMWFHADACFGGFFRLTDRGKQALKGIEAADSIAVDAHKSLFLPHGTAALLVKNASRLRAAFDFAAGSYLPGFRSGDEPEDLCRYGPELTREIRGLAAWLPLKMHGVSAFARTLDHKLDLAQRLADGLDAMRGITVVQCHPRVLPVVTFRHNRGHEATRRLCEAICAQLNCYVTTTDVPGHGTMIRTCVLRPETGEAVIDQFLTDTRHAISLLESGRRT